MIQTKIKHINQRDCMQCGAACITMIARSYGKDYSLSHVSSICQPQRHGVTLRVLDNTLRELGFDTLACTLSIDSLCENFPGPCILHWNNNHFVVLYRIKDKSKFYIDDPGVGKYVCSRHNFKKHWVTQQNPPSGIALLLEPGPRFLDIKPEAHEQKLKSWDTLKRHITTQKSALVKILTFLGICSILQFIMPFLMQEIVDTGIKHSNIGLIWLILAGELMIVAGKTITDFIRRRILLKVSTNLNISLISEFL